MNQPAPARPETPKRRGRPPGSEVKPLPDIPLDQFVIQEVPEDERGNTRRQRVERSRQQRSVDDKIMERYKAWRNAGKPTEWTEMPVVSWKLDSQYAGTAQKMLQKGALLHRKRLVIGNITEHTREGRKVTSIPFCVTDRKTRVTGAPADNAGDNQEEV